MHLLPTLALLLVGGNDATTNTWTKLDKAVLIGRRWDVPLSYAPKLKQFIILGGRTAYGEYRKQPRSYDVLHLDEKEGQWENAIPPGKDWGPRFGACSAPPWKDESFHLKDIEGSSRPNWTVYGTFSLGQKYDYDPDTDAFYFYAGGRTFRYQASNAAGVSRVWTDLSPATHPEKELGGRLLWSSMCYDRHNKVFVLFGGGNVETPRGDPGTWTYSPARNEWTRLAPSIEPPQRANSRLVFDPITKKVVLFGGDQLDQLVADTWTFDVATQQWEERKPPASPAPRAGHALLWLPRAKKVLLVGGYTYTSAVGYVSALYKPLPADSWTYDVAENRWDRINTSGETGPIGPADFFLGAAADDNDRVLIHATNGTWLCSMDSTKKNDAVTHKEAVRPGTVTRRTGPHDPAWFQENVPAADAAKVDADLKSLPANTWIARPTPKLPRPNMDWGSAVFAPELDSILRFSGGHSAYSGTAPQVYDTKTDRYRLPFSPEYPIEFVYSNDQVRGEWSFKGNPWMTGHTYKSTGYDPHLRCLVFAPHQYTYFFDPKTDRWSRGPERNPYRPNFYVVTVCSTPKGAVVWADRLKGGAGLWRLDAASCTWKELPLKGETPAKSADQHGMVYDARRDCLFLFSDHGKRKGDVAEYEFKTGATRWREPAGMTTAAVHSREAIFVDHADAALVGAHVPGPDGKTLWPIFFPEKNAWLGVELSGPDPVGKRAFHNSLGLMYDPNRRLVWAVGQNSEVHVLRFDPTSAKLHPLQ